MRGYIAVTDPGWYQQLSGAPGPQDANFWSPSTRQRRLVEGTPFFFKLRAPLRKIAGFGFFSSFTVLPDWLAWETFREANGVPELAALRARLGKIRRGARIRPDPGGAIGCCLIAESVFFPEDAWVDPPRDWRARTQQGAGYDLSQGEGARVWAECLARAASLGAERQGDARVAREEGPRYGAPALRRPRLGQGIFRVSVMDAYARACAVTQEHSLPVLEAAHIQPYASGGSHKVSNGLLLRSDLHRLFDRGYVTVDEDERFIVGRRLKEEFHNGRSYLALSGQRVVLPSAPAHRPDPGALEWHRREVFLG